MDPKNTASDASLEGVTPRESEPSAPEDSSEPFADEVEPAKNSLTTDHSDVDRFLYPRILEMKEQAFGGNEQESREAVEWLRSYTRLHDDEVSRAALEILAEYRLAKLRDSISGLQLAGSTSIALKRHFERYEDPKLQWVDSSSRTRLRILGLVVVFAALSFVYLYSFLRTNWPVGEILYGTLGGIVGLVIAIAVGAFIFWILAAVVVLISDAIIFGGSILGVVGVTAAFVASYSYLGRGLEQQPANDLFVALRAALVGAMLAEVMAIAVLAIFVAVASLLAFSSRSSVGRYGRIADSCVVVYLSEVLMTVAKDDAWLLLDDKNQPLEKLEAAAAAAEVGLPRLLATRDPYTDTWLKDQCAQVAASLRSLKRWICTPKSDTGSHLKETLVSLLDAAANGQWDEVRIEGVQPEAKLPVRVRILIAARTIGAGVAPLGVVLLLLHRGAISDPLATPVLLLSGSLAFVVLLGFIDARVLEKLGIAKDLAASTLKK